MWMPRWGRRAFSLQGGEKRDVLKGGTKLLPTSESCCLSCCMPQSVDPMKQVSQQPKRLPCVIIIPLKNAWSQ